MVSGDFDLPAGLSPVVITFDDASPGQFRYIEDKGQLKVDPRSAVGIWDAFAAKHPEWKGRGTFCVLTAANEGHALFGERGIQGQGKHRNARIENPPITKKRTTQYYTTSTNREKKRGGLLLSH